MNVIYKYLIDWDGSNNATADICIDSRIIDFQFQNGELYLWAIVDTFYEEKAQAKFEIYGTGREIKNPNKLKYLKTLHNNDMVWHIFTRI